MNFGWLSALHSLRLTGTDGPAPAFNLPVIMTAGDFDQRRILVLNLVIDTRLKYMYTMLSPLAGQVKRPRRAPL